MPVSNLTNLLAFAATGLGFVEFTLLMALPWLITLAVEFVVFCLFFGFIPGYVVSWILKQTGLLRIPREVEIA